MLHRLFNMLGARLLGPRLFHARFLNARLLHAGLLRVLRRSGFSGGRVLHLCLGFGFARHLQPVFFQLLRVDRLLGALVLLHLFRTAFATIRTIATPTAAATAAAVATPARFFALCARCTVAVLRSCVLARIRALIHRRPRLLLRTRLALLLVGTPFCLRLVALGPSRLSIDLRLLIAPLLLATGALRTRLLLLWGALFAPRLLFALSITIATLLVTLRVRTAAAAVALLIAAAFATSTAASVAPTITSAAPASATLAAPVFVPVARFVVSALGALRPRRTHCRFVCR